MCAVCEARKGLPDSDLWNDEEWMPLGYRFQQDIGEAAAVSLVMKISGGTGLMSDIDCPVQNNFLAGVRAGVIGDRQKERKYSRIDKAFAVGLTLLGVLLGWGIAQAQTTLFQAGG